MEIIKRYENASLSNYDIFNLLKEKIRILTYPELSRYNDINKVLSPNGCFILLYMSNYNYGHWCCVTSREDRLEFFNPYGDALPDDEFRFIPSHFRKISNQNYPHLTYLLYKSGLPIEYNNYKYQRKGNNIKTCGRHCVFRIMNKDLILEEYNKLMKILSKKLKMNYDEIVTFFTIKNKNKNMFI